MTPRITAIVEDKGGQFPGAAKLMQQMAEHFGCKLETRQTALGTEYTMDKVYKTREEEWA